MSSAARGLECRDAIAVRGLELTEVAYELGIDVVDGASPAGAGILIGRNDLIAKGFDGARFARGKELPGTTVAAARDHH